MMRVFSAIVTLAMYAYVNDVTYIVLPMNVGTINYYYNWMTCLKVILT